MAGNSDGGRFTVENLREIAQAAEDIKSRLRVAISMAESGQDIIAFTNIEQAGEACRRVKKRIEELCGK